MLANWCGLRTRLLRSHKFEVFLRSLRVLAPQSTSLASATAYAILYAPMWIASSPASAV